MIAISYTGVIRTHLEHRERKSVIVWTEVGPFHVFLCIHIAYLVLLGKGALVAFDREKIRTENRSAGIAGSISRNHCVLNELGFQKCCILNLCENVCQVFNFWVSLKQYWVYSKWYTVGVFHHCFDAKMPFVLPLYIFGVLFVGLKIFNNVQPWKYSRRHLEI